ncbi:MAG: LysR family transcriptional regulator [Spirochaetaceae bacterium]|nr:LysR family transcriptional regulator [Spirochaetaceae bacterium]
MDIEILRERARIIRKTRSFFDLRGYLELDTPLLAPDLIPETSLEVFETAYIPPRQSKGAAEKRWLIPSPEIWMKKLIAAHRTDMYQICKCFRNTESRGSLHNPEFTMLEYYTMDAGYEDSLLITEDLFRHLLPAAPSGEAPGAVETQPGPLSPPFMRITMEEAFLRWAGFSLHETAAAGAGALEAEGRRLGLDPPPGLDTATLYDLIFIHAIEPALPRDRPVAILDYPAFVPCLAKKKAGSRTVERWELYLRGIELANCYSEETDPHEVRRYFETESAVKEKTGRVRHKVDADYWKVFSPRRDGAFPRCSGVAMGVDRLIMALTGKSFIDSILPFTV